MLEGEVLMGALTYIVPALQQAGMGVSLAGVLAAALTATAVLIGVSNAVLHSSMRGWATDVALQARATTVSLFACALFLGSSLATYLTAGLAEEGQHGTIFTLSIVLAAAATARHAAWKRRQA